LPDVSPEDAEKVIVVAGEVAVGALILEAVIDYGWIVIFL
jgi:hypothetical protein